MKAPKHKTPSDASAMAFLNMARQYHEAARILFAESERRPKIHNSRQLSDPTYFLYFHTVELALKAFLRSHSRPILGTDLMSHKLTDLYAECRDLGLIIGPNDRFESGNEYQGFRYFSINSTTTADLDWVSEVVDALMGAVTSVVSSKSPGANKPGPIAKGTLIIGKPRPKTNKG